MSGNHIQSEARLADYSSQMYTYTRQNRTNRTMGSTFCRIKYFMLLLELSQILEKTISDASCFARISDVDINNEQYKETKNTRQIESNFHTGANEKKNRLHTDNQIRKFSMIKHSLTHAQTHIHRTHAVPFRKHMKINTWKYHIIISITTVTPGMDATETTKYLWVTNSSNLLASTWSVLLQH